MTIKELIALIREAIALEAQEGNALKEAKEKAEAKVVELEAKIAELTTMLLGANSELQEKAAEIAEAAGDLRSVVDDIKNINMSSVVDTIVEAVQDNPEIVTPPEIVDVPEVSTPEVTPVDAGEVALDAIEDSIE